MREHGLDTWVYSGNDWLITKIDAPHVAREAWTVKFEPKVVADVAEHLQQVAKIVGVSDDLDRVQRCEADSQACIRTACDGKPVAALLSRCHQQRRKQGRRCGISLASTSEYRRKRSLPSAINQMTC